jgi:hypothetical protein
MDINGTKKLGCEELNDGLPMTANFTATAAVWRGKS